MQAGDRVTIPPGAAHKLWAGPDAPLVLPCGCAPPYSDENATMLEGPQAGPSEAPEPDSSDWRLHRSAAADRACS